MEFPRQVDEGTALAAVLDQLEARFLAKVDRNGPGGCWLWTAGRAGGRGGYEYGHFWFAGRQRAAHRVAYELFIGPIPDGLTLDHLCEVKLCVNPAHLEPVTSGVNSSRSASNPSTINAAKTHCKHGHPFSGDNLLLRPDGGRACRECKRTEARERYRRKAARV